MLNYSPHNQSMQIEYAVFVPIFAGNARMSAINSIVRYASNVLKNAESVQIAVRKWRLKASSIEQSGVGNNPAPFFYFKLS